MRGRLKSVGVTVYYSLKKEKRKNACPVHFLILDMISAQILAVCDRKLWKTLFWKRAPAEPAWSEPEVVSDPICKASLDIKTTSQNQAGLRSTLNDDGVA